MSDHIFYPHDLASPYPYSPDGTPIWPPETAWPDNWVTIGAMAAVTERLQFGTSVYIAPARDLFTVAKQVGTAAVLSNNRVNLGVGAGWMREEFEQTGQEYGNRGRRLDEMIPRPEPCGAVVRSSTTASITTSAVAGRASPTQQVPIWCAVTHAPCGELPLLATAGSATPIPSRTERDVARCRSSRRGPAG
jgi:alkanesulfonate monooxygenase SsuD/methylene tetrahydromethanopterin reductase-like flavin-dependent oxidoreductase (luciferase family)